MFRNNIYLLALSFIGGKYEERYSDIDSTGAYAMLIMFIFFVLYSFFVPAREQMDSTTTALRNIMVITLFFQIFVTINPIVMRINYYWLIFVPLLIPRITNRWTKIDFKYKKIIDIGLYLFFTFYYLDKAHSVDSLNIYPYVFCWGE